MTLDFDPASTELRQLRYKNYRGHYKEFDVSNNTCTAESAIDQHAKGDSPSLSDLYFPDPDHFVAGQIHEHIQEWDKIVTGDEMKHEIMDWIKNGVDIKRYIQPFKGKFWGQSYDHDFPPARIFQNSNKCKDFIQFISDTIHERLCNGSIGYAGKVGVDEPPYIVSPLTVEPTKPRLCVNMMYLNNWIIDRPFRLDGLKDVSKTVKLGAYFTSLDDKSGYDNAKTHKSCQYLMGFQWGGYYFVAKTLPFGFKLSAFIYHHLNLQPVSYIRKSFNIPIFLYIDDRLAEEVRDSRVSQGLSSALLANYITCQILLRLGFCINLKKSLFTPTQSPTFLGFIVDSVQRCFRLTESKRSKFIELRDFCLMCDRVSVSLLQKFAGRCVSFMLAIPAAKLYTREINRGISTAIKSGGYVLMSGELREEILYWKFLDNWQGILKWKDERHLVVSMSSDSSLYKWGGRVSLPQQDDVEVSDFWPENMRHLPIMVLEAYALLNVLKAFIEYLRSSRVDANVDNSSLIAAWNNEGCRSLELNRAIKDIFSVTLKADIMLNLIYVPSADNVADACSRSIRKSDAMLSEPAWSQIQNYFGGICGHTCDMMALDSNCMKDLRGEKLPHFTPYPTPHSAGVNVFSQTIKPSENYYVFPPFNLTHPVLNLIVSNGAKCSLVIKCEKVTPVWLPALQEKISDAFLIGLKGQRDCLKFPSKHGFIKDRKGLTDNLWVIRLEPDVSTISYGKLLFCKQPNVGECHALLCIGDSIVRDLDKEQPLHNPLVYVYSQGGATINDTEQMIIRSVERCKPYAVVVHCGVNNLSKTYKYRDEFHQMSCAFSELSSLAGTLRMVCRLHDAKIVLSQCLTTKDTYINARADVFNSELLAVCVRQGWNCVRHDNIQGVHLRDTVHLNDLGRSLFVQNIMGVLRDTM